MDVANAHKILQERTLQKKTVFTVNYITVSGLIITHIMIIIIIIIHMLFCVHVRKCLLHRLDHFHFAPCSLKSRDLQVFLETPCL